MGEFVVLGDMGLLEGELIGICEKYKISPEDSVRLSSSGDIVDIEGRGTVSSLKGAFLYDLLIPYLRD